PLWHAGLRRDCRGGLVSGPGRERDLRAAPDLRYLHRLDFLRACRRQCVRVSPTLGRHIPLVSGPWLPGHAPGLHRGSRRLGAQYHHYSAEACGFRSGNRAGRGACVRDLALSRDEALTWGLSAAWPERAMNERERTIRPLHAVSEMRVCVALQRIVWGHT